ncbi:hypothetical protein FHG87_001011 [Trinorchestia longiramus]|nr:hypothetical protein FHG87_001011 [Trinorchestia longiramus]
MPPPPYRGRGAASGRVSSSSRPSRTPLSFLNPNPFLNSVPPLLQPPSPPNLTLTTGYYAVTDDVTSIDKLISKKATAAFEKINLTLINPQTYEQRDTTTTQRLLRDGFYMLHTKITLQQCEQEKYTYILIFYKCYKFEDHASHQCTPPTQHCSECSSKEHTYQQCTILLKQCLNCQGPHRTLAANCPFRKNIILQKQETEQRQNQEQTHSTYAKIAKHAIQHTNPP